MIAVLAAVFASVFSPHATTAAVRAHVVGGDAALARSLRVAVGAFLSGATQGGARLSVPVASISNDRVRFELSIRYRGGSYSVPFTGTMKDSRIGWATACFVVETLDESCPPPPPGAQAYPIPTSPLPDRFGRPTVPGLVRPEALAVAPNGDLLIVDTDREQLLRRAPGGTLSVVGGRSRIFPGLTGVAASPNGTIYISEEAVGRVLAIAPNGRLSTFATGLSHPTGVAIAPDGSVYVAQITSVAKIAPNGSIRTVARRGDFDPEFVAVDPRGDLFAFSFGTKTLFEFSPSGKQLRAWHIYANGLAAGRDGTIYIGEHGAALARIAGGQLAQVVDFTKRRLLGRNGAFDPEGVAVAPEGTVYLDTFVGDGWTNQTALAELTTSGSLHLLRTTTKLAATLPPVAQRACPSSARLTSFDARTRAEAVSIAKRFDTNFWFGVRSSDPVWWRGIYTDWIDGQYQLGKHAVTSVVPAADDVYALGVTHTCGAELVRKSLAVVIGRSAYSWQISHLYFLDRAGRVLLYWQHT